MQTKNGVLKGEECLKQVRNFNQVKLSKSERLLKYYLETKPGDFAVRGISGSELKLIVIKAILAAGFSLPAIWSPHKSPLSTKFKLYFACGASLMEQSCLSSLRNDVIMSTNPDDKSNKFRSKLHLMFAANDILQCIFIQYFASYISDLANEEGNLSTSCICLFFFAGCAALFEIGIIKLYKEATQRYFTNADQADSITKQIEDMFPDDVDNNLDDKIVAMRQA